MPARAFALLVVFLVAAWTLCFMLIGNTPKGKQWFGNLASRFFDDAKAGVPVLTLCIPILASGSLAVLFNVRSDDRPKIGPGRAGTYFYPRWVHRLQQRFRLRQGDTNFSNFAITFIFIPLAIYAVTNIHRHLHGHELSLDDKLKEIANSFAIMALVAFAYLLIPVTRQSAILKLLNWNPAAAVQLHIWSGRIIFAGVLLHGGLHMSRWRHVAGENVVSMLVPDRECWTFKDTDYEPHCVNEDTECSCYHHFRNLTGFLAFVGLLVIGGTSLNYVRRRHYRLFYMAHVMAAPTALIMSILHWHRSILYMAPSLLYYVASSFPVFIETFRKMSRKQGVKIVSVERLEPSRRLQGRGERPCISVTFEASDLAMQQFRPGQYIKILAPDIASNYHPFSVNRIPGKENQMRIIFRATGPFTYMLADRLTRDSMAQPMLYLDGLHGPSHRVAQVLKHDVAVLVAGGIGVTPYLTVLEEVKSILTSQAPALADSSSLPEIVLHWICRDMNLIQYVKTEYLDPLLRTATRDASFRIQLIVHNTSNRSSHVDSPELTPEVDEYEAIVVESNIGVAFKPSHFSPGTRRTICGNIPLFVAFSASSWLGLLSIWYFYSHVVDEAHVASRAWGAIAFVAIAVVVSGVANFLFGRCGFDGGGRLLDGTWWTSVVDDEEDTRIEMERIEEGSSRGEDMPHKTDLSDEFSVVDRTVSYTEKAGRPTVHDLLKNTQVATCPGLFVCGPSELVKELKSAAEERCLIRFRQCINGTPHIAIYEETFEM